ncbi:RNA helicase required for poly(A+) mRNA export [Mortierella claussenii]|nr:RNA helicase required for poly(A+) mRNA export [Mortierella claussenii]
MASRGHQISSLHGGLSPDERDRAMDDFRKGHTKVLITTNVLARGIDIERVNMVINYDLPTMAGGKADVTTYLHRIGRTGRFGRSGVSVNFVHNAESFEVMRDIVEHYQCQVTGVPVKLEAKDGPNQDDQEMGRLDRMERFFKLQMKL